MTLYSSRLKHTFYRPRTWIKNQNHILPLPSAGYHSSSAAEPSYELCIWRFVSPGCHSCKGYSFNCGSYLSIEELERREKLRSLEESLKNSESF